MKKIVLVPIVCALSFGLASGADADKLEQLLKELESLKKEIKELKTEQEKQAKELPLIQTQLSAVKAHDSGDNIKFIADLRTSYDYVDYRINGGENKSNDIWSNRLILGMSAQPTDNLRFLGTLQANKMFGTNQSTMANSFQNFDWYASTTPDDSYIRLREAYFIYDGDIGSVPYTLSLGRRPAINGFLGNLRESDDAASPIAHNINMEFDGASFMVNLEDVTDLSGLYLKLCLGRGNTNADGKYPQFTGYPMMNTVHPSPTHTPYVKSDFDAPNMDLAGIIAQLYNDGQYQVMFNYFMAFNVMDADFSIAVPGDPSKGYYARLTDVGDMSGGALSMQIDGIGNGISDFLDDTIFFASFAWSRTDPKGKHSVIDPSTGNTMMVTEMLGTSDDKFGSSIYVGVQMPSFFGDNSRFGLEYNHGSKYWRSFTYGEDTLIGSKMATRGNAYEAYWTKPLVGKNLEMQIRYTYIDYDYTGSDMFFGSTGTPMDVSQTPGAVEKASNLRAYIRYRY